MKVPTKRSLNRYKSIWIVRISYNKHSLAVSNYSLSFFSVWAKINKHWAHILINTGAMRDFMSLTFVKRAKVPFQEKSDIYKVITIDYKLLLYNNEIIDHKTEEIRL